KAGQIGAAARPLLALGMVPQRTDHVPALAMIDGAEESARQRSAPDDAGLVGTACLERPDARRGPVQRPAPHVVLLVALRLGRIGGCRDLLPAIARRAVQFCGAMALVERRIAQSVAAVLEREGDVVAQGLDPRGL